MEREQIFGAAIVLIIIIVIVLIVYNMQGSAMQDIRNIADEVFGWAKSDQQAEAARLGEAEAQRFMDRLVEIHGKSFSAGAGCTYDLRGYTLPEKYRVEMVYINSQDTVIKFNLMDNEDDKMITTKTLDKKQTEWKLESCYMEDATKRVQGGNTIAITYTRKGGLKAGTNTFYEDIPKFYKYDGNHLCFITQTRGKETEYKKYFLETKDCESGLVNGNETAKDFFNGFMSSVKACKLLAKGTECKCDLIDFTKLPIGGTIKGIQDGNSIRFELYFTNEKIMEDNLADTQGVTITSSLLKKEPNYEKWTSPITYDQSTKQLYVTLTTNLQELGFAWPSAVTPSSILILLFKDRITSCAPAYDTADKNCQRKLDPQLVVKRLQDNKYDQIIMKATTNERERYTIAGVIATESEGRNEVVSKSNCAGLMQFSATTAKGYSIPCDKGTCYVCDPRGCNTGDNRQKPEIAIPAGLDLLKKKMDAIEKCTGTKGYTYREIFGLAAYNAGEGVICSAIKATKKADPTWDEVKAKIDKNLLRTFKDYNTPIWTNGQLDSKITETKCYPYYVETYMVAFTGRLFGEQQTTPKTSQTKISSILIDPGHGGNQPGAVYGQLREADANLATALKLKDMILQKYPGIKVDMTRTTDVFVDLNERARMASGYDLFISVHYDSAKTGKALIYYPSKNLRPENLAFAKELAQKLGVPLIPSSGSNYNQLYIDEVKEPTLSLLWEVDSLDKYSSNENYIVAKDSQVINFLDSYVASA
jgi:N-acetylmuramoyl-L-alanine amidase